MKLKIINDDAKNHSMSADMIFTDPPFDIGGKELNDIIKLYKCDHLVLITTMKQLLEFSKYSEFEFSFDFVLDAFTPKKSKSNHYPNYTHQTCVYMKKKNVKSTFNRKLRQRSDCFDNTGYWPTIVRAKRDRMIDHGMSKNITAITDILGCFKINSVIDMFGGSGTTAMAAFELGISDCIIIEKDSISAKKIKDNFKFMGVSTL